jgi:hypothetical protein
LQGIVYPVDTLSASINEQICFSWLDSSYGTNHFGQEYTRCSAVLGTCVVAKKHRSWRIGCIFYEFSMSGKVENDPNIAICPLQWPYAKGAKNCRSGSALVKENTDVLRSHTPSAQGA